MCILNIIDVFYCLEVNYQFSKNSIAEVLRFYMTLVCNIKDNFPPLDLYVQYKRSEHNFYIQIEFIMDKF